MRTLVLIIAVFVLPLPAETAAQEMASLLDGRVSRVAPSNPGLWTAPDTTTAGIREFGRSLGGQIVLANSGFGLGAHLRFPIAPAWTFSLETSIGAGKDEREIAFFDRLGRKDVPNKANYFLVVPLHFGLERRLFRRKIEDNFRPFSVFAAGPTLGWEYPYFDDRNGNGLIDENEGTFDSFTAIPKGSARWGAGALIGIGAHFGRSQKLNQGVLLGYHATHFPEGIQLLERGIRGPQSFFGTPVIQVYFGRFR